MRIDPQFLMTQIKNLLIEYPELADDEELRVDTLEGQTSIKEALTAILAKIDNDEMMFPGIAERKAELTERKKRLERRVEFWRAVILKVMQWSDLKKLELPVATLSQRAGQRKVLGDPDVGLLPDHLVKVTYTPDKTAIKDALLRGEFVPECSLSNAEPSLAIHPK